MESLNAVWTALPYILQGIFVTLTLVLGALTLGFVVGLPLAVLHVYAPKPIQRLVGLYVWFFRGVPILLLLFLFYYGLFKIININLGAVSASCIVLGLASSAYQSQIFRGSIINLPQGQMKAARALGMSDLQGIQTVILPQALRLSIPGWSNEYSILLKDSALCFVLGAPEIMARTHFVAARTYEFLALYTTAGIIYFFITLAGVYLLRKLEVKIRIPGYTVAGI